MDSIAFTCNLCGSVCPIDCFPLHRDTFTCHNTACLAHAPFNPDRVNTLRQHIIFSAPMSLLPTQADALDGANSGNVLSAGLPREEGQEEQKEGDKKSMAAGQTQSQQQKVQELVQDTPYHTALGYLFVNTMMPSISEIVPGLFIGNMACVDNESVLKKYNINAVISVVSPRRMPFPSPQLPQSGSDLHPLQKLFTIKDHMVIVAHDRCSENLIKHFDGTCKFIYQHRHPVTSAAVADSDTDARSDQEKVNLLSSFMRTGEKHPKGGRVLVHCTQGVSRSATIVAAYLMWRKRESAAKILRFIKNKRPQVDPNDGFLDQLVIWQDVSYEIWDNKQFCVLCPKYLELQRRLLDYRYLELLKKATRRLQDL